MPVTYNKPNRYDYVSRKVHDRAIDRQDRRHDTSRQMIYDLEGVIKKNIELIKLMQHELDELIDHVAQHCLQIDDDRRQSGELGNEGLE